MSDTGKGVDDEVREIQRIWRMEQGDWRNTAYSIYERVVGVKFDDTPDDSSGFGEVEQDILEDICSKVGVPPQLVSRLLNTELEHYGMSKHAKIFPKINNILAEEWREDLGEIIEDLRQGKLDAKKYGGTK